MVNDGKGGNYILMLRYMKPVDNYNNMKTYSQMGNYFCLIARVEGINTYKMHVK